MSTTPATTKHPEIDEEECLDFLSKLIQIKSYSKTEGENAATQFMANAMKSISLDADVYPFDNGTRQNAIGVWHGTGLESDRGAAKTLLFNGHVDTNPVSGGWTIDPWAGMRDNEFIYGIGVSNMKSGCAAYYCAVKTLKAAGWKPRGSVILTYVVGELQGGVGTVAAIEQGRCDNADYFVNCEPSDIRAITMHAESLVFRITLKGITRHMSAREEAVDAILAACDLIPRLTKMTFNGALTDEHRKINRCHVGVVHGALGPDLEEWRPPQVADYVVLSGSARYAPGQERSQVLVDIQKVIEAMIAEKWPGLTFDLTPVEYPTMPAFEVSPESRIVKALNTAYKSIRGEDQPTGVLPPPCFYGSDAGHLYKTLGMEGIVCGPGGRYNTRPDEKVDIVDYLDCIKMFIRLIVDICG
jgi:acetylornithine deacetylase